MSDAIPGPLDGVRIISFGAFIAGNVAGGLLAELGADVVKIEARARPEVLRTPTFAIGGSYVEPSGAPQTVMYGALSRGARGVSIDLANEAARPLFHEMVAASDVLIENFAGPTLARWGCAFEDLLVDNPQLVWLSLSGYGRTGPRARYLAYASNISGYVGLSSAWGYGHGSHSDYITAETGALAVVSALVHAQATAKGVYLDVAQIDAMAQLMTPALLDPLVNDRQAAPACNEVPGSWFVGVYQCIGHDAWVAIDIEDGEDWAVLCRFLENQDLIAATREKAVELRGELEVSLLTWLADKTAHTVAHLLQKEGLAVVPVQDTEDIWRDPQLRARNFFAQLPQPDYGSLHYPNSVLRLSRSPGELRRAGPRLGADTYAVLREWLGTTDDQLAELAGHEAVFQAPA